jgi:hypothetical protein
MPRKTTSPPVASARGRLAVAVRDGRDPQVIAERRRDLLSAKVTDQVRAWVRSLPAPTPEQVREVAEIVNGGPVAALSWPQPPEGKKRCGRCGEIKPLDEFGQDARASDAHNWRCRVCRADAARRNGGDAE